MKIEICANDFLMYFPYFEDKFQSTGALQRSIDFNYKGVDSIISTNLGDIKLPEDAQIRGVYLAVAHKMYLGFNPDAFRPLTNVSQGSESAGFVNPIIKNNRDYYLSTTPYGVELLSILNCVVPLIPEIPNTTGIYYNGLRKGF